MAPWTSAAVSTTASTGFLQVRQLEFLKFLLNNWNSYTEFKFRNFDRNMYFQTLQTSACDELHNN